MEAKRFQRSSHVPASFVETLCFGPGFDFGEHLEVVAEDPGVEVHQNQDLNYAQKL